MLTGGGGGGGGRFLGGGGDCALASGSGGGESIRDKSVILPLLPLLAPLLGLVVVGASPPWALTKFVMKLAFSLICCLLTPKVSNWSNNILHAGSIFCAYFMLPRMSSRWRSAVAIDKKKTCVGKYDTASQYSCRCCFCGLKTMRVSALAIRRI